MKKQTFIPNDIIGRIVKSVVGKDAEFKPRREFYRKVKIRQKRFWQLMRGEASPTIDEIQAVAKYLKRNLQVDIPLIQLTLFDDNDKEILNAKI